MSSIKAISTGVAFLNVIIAADDFTRSNGSIHSTIDLGVGIVAIVFPEIGVIYAIFDLTSRAITDNSMSEAIEELKMERRDKFREEIPLPEKYN